MSGLDFQLPDTLVEEDLLGLLNGFPGYNPTEPVLSFPTTGLPQRQQSQSRSDEGSAEAQQDLEMDTDARLRSKIKNKTAQKRFRERQKSKAQENERRVAELSRELDAVRLENTRSLLENLVLFTDTCTGTHKAHKSEICQHSADCQPEQQQWRRSCSYAATSRYRCSWIVPSPNACWCVCFSRELRMRLRT